MSAPLRSPDECEAKHGFISLHRALRREVRAGLRASPRTLPPKLFYDDQGALLFEQICATDEYYLTRAELEILRGRCGEIAELAGPRCALVEYGSGAGIKVRLLLEALETPVAYVPVDISREQLRRVARELASDYPAVRIQSVCADYTRQVRLPALPTAARRLVFFPGSTIGNFHPTEATAFLRRVRNSLGPGGALVLGLDRRKDPRTLNRAYNDAGGITAAFNLNVLARLNRDFCADFDLRRFRHRAFFNQRAGRVEMHLECTAGMTVHVAGEVFEFAAGQTIWTESSYKYDEQQVAALARAAGFQIERLWTDDADQFWVAMLLA